jgi:hypothetical protein
MAEQTLIPFSVNIGTLTNGLLPILKVPAGFGGLTLVSAQTGMLIAGTAQLYLVNGGAVGTTTSGGTAATPGGTAHSAKTPIAMSVVSTSAAYFAEGEWLTVKENNVGTCPPVTIISGFYKWGK